LHICALDSLSIVSFILACSSFRSAARSLRLSTLSFFLSQSFALHALPAVLLLQPLKSPTLSHQLSERVGLPVLIPSVVIPRPNIVSRSSSLSVQIRPLLTTVRVYKLAYIFLTYYLLNYPRVALTGLFAMLCCCRLRC